MTAWCEEGLSPEEFWRQTPRTFMAVVEGRRRAAMRDLEGHLFAAYNAERFARTKHMKPLSHYINELKPKKRQTGDEILASFRAFAERGAPITFKKVERGRKA